MSKQKKDNWSSRLLAGMIVLMIIPQLVSAQRTDTADVSALMRKGESLIDNPGSDAKDLNSAGYLAAEIELQSNKGQYRKGLGQAKLLLAKVAREKGDFVTCRKLCAEAVSYFNEPASLIWKAAAMIELGGSYSNSVADAPMKIARYEEGIALYHQAGDKRSEATLMEFLGDLLQLHREHDKALKVLEEALLLYKEIGYVRLQGIHSVMGEVYHGMNNFSESLRHNLLALEYSEKQQETSPLMVTIYNRIGLNYYSVKYFDQAITYFNKGLALARQQKDSATAKTMLLNIADALRNRDEFKRSLDTMQVASSLGESSTEYEKMHIQMIYLKNYISLKQFDKADVHYRKLVQSYNSTELSGNTRQLLRLAVIYYLQSVNRFKETVPYLDDYMANPENATISLIRKADGELLAFRTDSALGNLATAIEHLQRFKMMSDTLTSITQSRQLGLMGLQFETSQKDKNIALLTQQSQLQKASLKNTRLVRNVFIGGVCMLIMVSALLYNRFRLKKKVALKLESKQDEINAQNETLKKLLDDKEWLLKEIHHRVKNNLQIVISLLNTQSQYLDNEDAIAAIKNSQHRMYAMSLIHQRLYQNDNLGKIDMFWYIRELMGYMKESFDTADKISFHIDNDQISLDVIQAVPLGLILNEAVSNSIKYAFPGNRKGRISVGLKTDADCNCRLTIADNGIGFMYPQNTAGVDSLGMSLMQGLAEQLEGKFKLESTAEGVRITVDFICKSLAQEITNNPQ